MDTSRLLEQDSEFKAKEQSADFQQFHSEVVSWVKHFTAVIKEGDAIKLMEPGMVEGLIKKAVQSLERTIVEQKLSGEEKEEAEFEIRVFKQGRLQELSDRRAEIAQSRSQAEA